MYVYTCTVNSMYVHEVKQAQYTRIQEKLTLASCSYIHGRCMGHAVINSVKVQPQSHGSAGMGKAKYAPSEQKLVLTLTINFYAVLHMTTI